MRDIKKWQHNINNQPITNNQYMNHLLFKSLTTAVIITIVFLALSQFDVYLEENYDITGYHKNFLKAPVQFALIFVVSMTVMHFFSHWFHVKT